MEEIKVKTEEKRVSGSPIYYYVSGAENSECIVFLHAAYADHTQFNSQVNFFTKNYKVIAVDMLGHGKSTDAAKGDGIEKMAEYIASIADAENAEKIHLAGVSLGAVVVQDFANKFPDRTASIACFGGYNINNFDVSMQKENSGTQMGMMLKAIFSTKSFAKANMKISAVTPQAQQDFYEMNLRFPKKSFMYLAGLNGMVNKVKPTPRDYPLLIGCGDSDIPMELKVCELWHNEEPTSKKVVIPNSGHLVNMDAPDSFNDIMQKFLKNEL